MGIHYISSLKTTDVQGKGTMGNPFILTPSYSDGCDEVEFVNLNESVVSLGEGEPLSFNTFVSEMPMLQNGKTTDMFRGCPLDRELTIVFNSTWADSVPSDIGISISEGFADVWNNATPLPNGNIKSEYRKRLLD